MSRRDLVVVGGGIAGASLAAAMARTGADVLLLERQTTYRDHVRGELLWPWGVTEARALGVESVLLDAGANRATTFESHDEGRDAPYREQVAALDGPIGSLNLAHATACGALADAAREAGATVLAGVRDVVVTPGEAPEVRFVHDGRMQEERPRLVVGADGRTSAVRRQAGIPLEVDEPAHLVAGLLAEGIEGADVDVDLIAREADLLFLTFPQGDGQARLYHCFPTEQRDRFAGADAATRFLASCALTCLPDAERWSGARAAGPCATFPACDARAATPVVPGVVLIGDAAGYENPLLGQGLSMAFRDARDVAAVLTSEPSWTTEVFAEYAADRARRHDAAKLATLVEVWINDGYERQDPALRARRREHVFGDELLTALDATTWTGFDRLPAGLSEQAVAERLAA